MSAISKRPYFLRALFDWIVDSEMTPHILVAVDGPEVHVPEQHVRDGKIVLNISPAAVRNLALGDELVSFDGRFSGAPFGVEMPVSKVEAIYAKETGEGMVFEPEPQQSAEEQAPAKPGEDGASHLKVVK